MRLPITMNKNLWLGVVFTLMTIHLAIAADHASDLAVINGVNAIDVSTVQGGVMLVKVTVDGSFDSAPVGVSLNNPFRIYFDLHNISNALDKNFIEINEGNLNSINIVEVGDRTRLVLNLSKLMSQEVSVEDNTFLIKLEAIVESMAVGSVTHFPEGVPDKENNSLRDIDFQRGVHGEGRIVVDLMQMGTGIDVRQQGEDLVVEFMNTLLPSNLERWFDVTDFATPIRAFETYTHGENVLMVVKPTGAWEHSSHQTDTQFVLEVNTLAESKVDEFTRNLEDGGYSGEKLSLNFQNVDVRAVLQVIADFTDLNIIASDTVAGNLTLRLKDVPWDHAFDIVLQATGLDKRKTGNVIFVAPSEEMAAKELLELEARLQISELEPVRTEMFHLNHRRVDSISFEGMLSERGTINADEISNSLTVTDIPERLSEIKKRIDKLDVFERQVMIEARIVEAIDEFSRDLGARFGVSKTNLSGSSNVNTISSNLPAKGTGAFGAGAIAGGPATLGLSLLKVNNSTLVDLELSALETDNKGRIISSPRVVTAHGVEALIEQGDRVPFQQATSSGATSIRFVNATLSLKVKPLITYDNKIDMELTVNQDKIGETINQFLPPPINTKKVTTKVLVDNGGTVVIGGIFERTENEARNRIPLLGDIPIFGHLFRNSARIDDKRELMVFVTPRILSEDLNLQ